MSSACASPLVIGDRAPDEAPPTSPPSEAPPLAPAPPPEEKLGWEGAWEWLAPQTTTHTLRAGWAAANDDVWLVGEAGTVLRWDGKTRARIAHQGPITATYSAIAAMSKDDVWIAGKHAALHFNGTSWTESVLLAAYDVRTLIRCDDGVVGLTTDGTVVTTSTGATAMRDVLDITPASAGGFYMLRRDGVEWLQAGKAAARVASFAARTSAFEGRLLGDAPERFGYVFAEPGTSLDIYTFYAGPPDTTMGRTHTIPKLVAPEKRVFARIGLDRFVIRGGHNPALLYDQGTFRFDKAWSPDLFRMLGAFPSPSGEAWILGNDGLVGKLDADASDPAAFRTVTVGGADRASSLGSFGVATDGTAFSVRATTRGDSSHYDTLGAWNDATGWQWQRIPAPFEWITAIAPLTKTNVWAVLRTVSEASPHPAGKTLAHFDGSKLDVTRTAPKDLRLLQSDGDGGFYALALDGTLYRGSAGGELTMLGDAGTAGESDFALCTPLIAPIRGGKAFVLDQTCRLSLWDGTKIAPVPSFRGPEHGSGWIEFSMWASSPTSLWLTDPQRGLRHFDGSTWKLVWESQLSPRGTWGIDDEHVWFIDRPWNWMPGSAATLKQWDGRAMRTVAATPGAAQFGGSRDTVWVAGDALLRLRATRPNVR